MERTKERSSFRKKFIGDRKFYMMVLAVAVPIMIQNGITNYIIFKCYHECSFKAI